MKVYRCLAMTKEIERLRNKHREIWQDIDRFERLLALDQVTWATEYSGLRLRHGSQLASIWKARVVATGLGGKSKGYRYVYERITFDNELCAVGLTIHLHQDDIKESEIRSKIKTRSRLLDPDQDWKRNVEPATPDS